MLLAALCALALAAEAKKDKDAEKALQGGGILRAKTMVVVSSPPPAPKPAKKKEKAPPVAQLYSEAPAAAPGALYASPSEVDAWMVPVEQPADVQQEPSTEAAAIAASGGAQLPQEHAHAADEGLAFGLEGNAYSALPEQDVGLSPAARVVAMIIAASVCLYFASKLLPEAKKLDIGWANLPSKGSRRATPLSKETQRLGKELELPGTFGAAKDIEG